VRTVVAQAAPAVAVVVAVVMAVAVVDVYLLHSFLLLQPSIYVLTVISHYFYIRSFQYFIVQFVI
jgi:hypothetical protein